jgi:hypothetical protein
MTAKVGYDKMSPGKQDIEIFGNRTTTIETGNDNLTLKVGSKTTTVMAGSITHGDAVDHAPVRRQHHLDDAPASISADIGRDHLDRFGAITQTAGGAFMATAAGVMALTAGGAATLPAGGPCTIHGLPPIIA